MAGVDPRELRELLVEVRAELARVRSTVTRAGDDTEVVRARVDELTAHVERLVELEQRRHDRELAREQVELDDVRTRASSGAALEADRIEARRWLRVSVLERVAVPALTAALSVVIARCSVQPAPTSAIEPAAELAAPATEDQP